MKRRFTVDGSAGLEDFLAEACDKVLASVYALIAPSQLEGMFLGGGYGRGEGGVWRTPHGDKPYNDLEFYLLLNGNCRLNELKYRHCLHVLAQQLSSEVEVDVEFKVLSRRKLERSPITMGYHDLVAGHRQLWGGKALLSRCGHHLAPQTIPLYEATRLLMNRCSGLLFAEARLRNPAFSGGDADFVGRNQAKAQLAFGDVFLTAFGRYHGSCRERARRLRSLSTVARPLWLEEVRRLHSLGVEFKLHPQKQEKTRDAFISQQCSLRELSQQIWLWLESRRLSPTFYSIAEYATSALNKCPETNAQKNALINLRTFGWQALKSARCFRYPRERLLETLPLLLWTPECLQQLSLLEHVQHQLATQATDYDDLIKSYATLWHQFN